MIPDDFECSTTLEIMRDPMLCVADGHKYERSAIEAWFRKGKSTSPRTNVAISTLQLAPNRLLKQRIEVLYGGKRSLQLRKDRKAAFFFYTAPCTRGSCVAL